MNKLNKKTPTLSESFARINSKKLRWQGILELNMIEDVSNIDDILEATKDSFWMTRWVAVTKLEQLKNNKAINVLLNLLDDDDETVRKSTARAIHACAKHDISPLLRRCCDENTTVFKFVKEYVQRNLLTYYQQIELAILYEKPLVANYLLLIIFNSLKEKAESLLIKASKLRNTQKHALMMLAIINSKKAIPIFISLYEKGYLKRHIIQAFYEINDKNKLNNLIEYHKIKEVRPQVEQLIIKLAPIIFSTIIVYLQNNKYTEFLRNCLYKMNLNDTQKEYIKNKIKYNEHLKQIIDINELKPK